VFVTNRVARKTGEKMKEKLFQAIMGQTRVCGQIEQGEYPEAYSDACQLLNDLIEAYGPFEFGAALREQREKENA